MKLEFSRQILKKNTQISNSMKIRPMGAELFHVDRQTDRRANRHDEGNSCFTQFYERAWKKKSMVWIQICDLLK